MGDDRILGDSEFVLQVLKEWKVIPTFCAKKQAATEMCYGYLLPPVNRLLLITGFVGR